MDKHYLTPLFSPETVAVFAGRQDDDPHLTSHAKALHEALRAQRYTGRLVFVDLHTTGTLADLAQTRGSVILARIPDGGSAAAVASLPDARGRGGRTPNGWSRHGRCVHGVQSRVFPFTQSKKGLSDVATVRDVVRARLRDHRIHQDSS